MILRNAIAAVAVALLLLVGAIAIGEPAARGPACVLALLTAAVLFENRRYRRRGGRPSGMTPTNERFVDPETGRTMRVWASADGERRYVEE